MKRHSAGFQALCEDAGTRVPEVTVEEVLAQWKKDDRPVLLDVREQSEFGAGHVCGAVHLGKGVIERDVEKLFPNKDQSLVLYCGGGFRSLLAGDSLIRMGYRQVWSLAGGWRAWNAANGPVDPPRSQS